MCTVDIVMITDKPTDTEKISKSIEKNTRNILVLHVY